MVRALGLWVSIVAGTGGVIAGEVGDVVEVWGVSLGLLTMSVAVASRKAAGRFLTISGSQVGNGLELMVHNSHVSELLPSDVDWQRRRD